VEFVGARRSSRVAAGDLLPGRVNYLYGDDPKQWRTNVPTYARAHTTEIYRGIDVDYYGVDLLEYDFIVRPGARLDAIRLRVSGESVAISDDGNLVYGNDRRVLLRRPVAYQKIGGARIDVPIDDRQRADRTFGFSVGRYDRRQLLIIDPVVAYTFTFSGSAPVAIYDMAVDDQGAVYVGGQTFSATFPTVRAAGNYVDAGAGNRDVSAEIKGCSDGFLAKLTPDGSALEYATYFGSPGLDFVGKIEVDGSHALYFNTGSVIGKLAPDGSRFLYTFTMPLGANDFTVGPDCTVYTLFIGGTSATNTFPITAGAARTTRTGMFDGVIMHVSFDGAILYSTYVGVGTDVTVTDLAVDSAGNVVAAGDTGLNNFCTPQTAHQAFITRLSADGSSLSPANFFPYPFTFCRPFGVGIALDGAANAHTSVCGRTDTSSRPLCDFWKVDPSGFVLEKAQGVPSAAFVIDRTGNARWFARPLSYSDGADAQVVKLVPAIAVKSLTASTSLPSRFALPITSTLDVEAEQDVEYSFWRYDATGWSRWRSGIWEAERTANEPLEVAISTQRHCPRAGAWQGPATSMATDTPTCSCSQSPDSSVRGSLTATC
jgi:hypothetical protein